MKSKQKKKTKHRRRHEENINKLKEKSNINQINQPNILFFKKAWSGYQASILPKRSNFKPWKRVETLIVLNYLFKLNLNSKK